MRDMKESILLFAVLMFFLGSGKKAEAAAPQGQPKAKEAKKAETAIASAQVETRDNEQALTTLKQAVEGHHLFRLPKGPSP